MTLHVCGILVQGYKPTTYRLNLASPLVYRLVHLTACSMFKSIEEFTLIPQIISAIIQVKNYALLAPQKYILS
ncbi:hypothetical protein INT45_008901 [Circinella minor]|uniref:Uncharacterized protein n=1 Tax=Circinella minor TaxID=1195481 RepID=A0A8H7RZI5_9FUNG|nr:hypothetical protein INT45_008901 [Circinella minor]